MTVIQRLGEIAKPFKSSLYTALTLTFIGTFLETAVVSSLLANLISLVTKAVTIEKPVDPADVQNASHMQQWLAQQLAPLQAYADQFASRFVHIDRPQEMLLFLSLLTGIVVLLKCALSSRGHYLMNRFANLMAREIRQRLFGHLVHLPPSYFEKESTGGQLSRITNDVVILQQCLGPQLAQVLQAPFTIVISVLIMFFVSWRLMLAVLCLAPLIALLMAIAGKKIRRLAVTMQDRLGDLNGSLVERLTNIRVVQSFVREQYETTQVADYNKKYYKETMRSVLVTELLSPGVEALAWIGMIIGVILGGNEVLNYSLEPADFLFFMLLAQRAGSQFKQLSRINQLRQQATGTGERIFSTLDIIPEIQDVPDAQALPHVQGHLVFEGVSFHYRTGDEVLKDIDIRVQPGEVIALVGPSGSGKTTLVNLLPRFYDPTAGRILIEGMDLRQVTLDSLRAQVGIVPQETLLFSGSIYDNILYGKLEATREEVIDAARAANALEFIERLPDGFQTVVGERGARLSGGQRQRVAIARALLKNPRILILDEATSALDTESEHLVQQALDRLMENRTTFVIAHRLSTVKHATRILVMEHGRIVEAGTHPQLLALNGLYRRLYDMQFRTGEQVEMVTE